MNKSVETWGQVVVNPFFSGVLENYPESTHAKSTGLSTVFQQARTACLLDLG
jgi:hypothetical protein